MEDKKIQRTVIIDESDLNYLKEFAEINNLSVNKTIVMAIRKFVYGYSMNELLKEVK